MPKFTKEGSNTAGMKGSEFYGYGNAAPKYRSPMKKEEFPGLLPEVNVKASEHQTPRDEMAKKALSNINPTGGDITSVKQGVRSKAYKHADKYLGKKRAKETRENTEK